MIADIKDQELVIDCDDALLIGVSYSQSGDRILQIQIKAEDSKVLDVMKARERLSLIPVGVAIGQKDERGGYVNQLLAIKNEIGSSPVEPAKKARNVAQREKGKYSAFAKALKLSVFFRSKDVWKACGSDASYQAWCRQQRCAYTKSEGSELDPIEAAHVRRVSDGAGVSIKNDYATIPLLKSVHRKQHDQGEESLASREWFEKARIHYVSVWAWGCVKTELGYGSFSDVPPVVLCEWAEKRGVLSKLPEIYRQS